VITGCVKDGNEENEKIYKKEVNPLNTVSDKDTPWYNSYNLDCEKIIIAVADGKGDKPHNNLKSIFEVSDTARIEEIKNSINISEWEKIDPENRAKGEPYFYIIIGEDTIIRMYSDIPYGGIANYSMSDGYYKFSNYSGDYNISHELFSKLWEYLVPYYDELDVEPYNDKS
jgi:hypothetical protein